MITFPGLSVDRRLFIPDEVWVIKGQEWARLSRATDPEEWEKLVATDKPIIIQLKDGSWPSSSSSAPAAMRKMIDALKIKPGMTILEIGTGTGYNAACLAALGAEVVTVEIDPDLSERARVSLHNAGYP